MVMVCRNVMSQRVKEWLKLVPGVSRTYRWVMGLPSYDAETPKDRFTRYAKTNVWGNSESVSGPGSTIKSTEHIRQEILKMINEHNISRILDAPCGDYNWFKLIPRSDDIQYIGGDIVEELIESNNEKYGNKKTLFIYLDVTKDPLPETDLWVCRDLLIHFSDQDVFLAFQNLLKSDIKFFLTTSYTGCAQNMDIPTGGYREINLQLSPFHFPEPSMWIDDCIEGYPTRKLGLWEIPRLTNSMASNTRPFMGENIKCHGGMSKAGKEIL